MANTDAYKYELFILKQAQGKKLSPSQRYQVEPTFCGNSQ
jgi:hypothetical protein